MADLNLLRFVLRSAKSNRDIIRHVIATNGEHAGVNNGAILEDSDVARASADINQRDAKLLFILRENGLT